VRSNTSLGIILDYADYGARPEVETAEKFVLPGQITSFVLEGGGIFRGNFSVIRRYSLSQRY